MKVALLLSGHYRTFEQNYASLKQNLLDLYDIDIFMYTWDDYGFWTPDENDTGGVYKTIKFSSDFITKIVKPKKYKIEKMDDHLQIIKDLSMKVKNKRYHFVRPINITGLWYSLHNCDLLRREYEKENNLKYDVIIRGRFDIFYSKPVIIDKTFTICTDVWGELRDEGYGDVFYYGPNEDMTKITDMILNFDEIGQIPFDSHAAFRYWANKHLTNIQSRDFGITLYNTPGGTCKGDSLSVFPNLHPVTSEKT